MSMDETLSRADQHAIRLHSQMALAQARRLKTREERVVFLTRQAFRGPHGGQARFSPEAVQAAVDLMEVSC